MARKYKRYFTGSDNRGKNIGQGKGSDRRPMQVTEEEFADRWEQVFGKKQEEDDQD